MILWSVGRKAVKISETDTLSLLGNVELTLLSIICLSHIIKVSGCYGNIHCVLSHIFSQEELMVVQTVDGCSDS